MDRFSDDWIGRRKLPVLFAAMRSRPVSGRSLGPCRRSNPARESGRIVRAGSIVCVKFCKLGGHEAGHA
ncbi:hypothetical protein, partial [Hoeflea olei]|uniref:hypothetical protein n=1 Tax=Hoeflea olei TaxID=1480615 RepID=UPI001AEC9C2F